MMTEDKPMPPSRRMLLGVAATGAAAIGGGGQALGAASQGAPAAATVSSEGVMRVPAHDVPMPESIGPKARGYLTQLARMTASPFEVTTDVEELRKRAAAFESGVGGFYGSQAAHSNTTVETQQMGGVTVYVAARKEATPAERRKVHLYIHGGAFVFGGGKTAMYAAQLEARRFGGTVVSVDYRMPPDHPYPAALDDCLAVYRDLLRHLPASAIFVSGESAGGNLSAALMHKARDAGLPKPAAVFLFTPGVDFAVQGDSRAVNAYVDVVLKASSFDTPTQVYANGADLRSPYLSPLYGDLAAAFPPTYLRSGTRDRLLSDTVRMHAALRKAGVDAELYVGEGMPHSGFPDDTPEQAEANADTARWLARHWRV